MNKYIQYPDLPQIPDHLINSAEHIIQSKEIEIPSSVSERVNVKTLNNYPEMRPIEPRLHEFLKSIFKEKFKAVFIVSKKTLNIHKDLSSFAMMWIVDSGGDNINTAFYKEEVYPSDIPYYECDALFPEVNTHFLDYKEVLPIRTWVKLSSHSPHAVLGNLIRPRVYLSISLESAIKSDLPIDKRPNL